MTQDTIHYAGRVCRLLHTTDDQDEAQALIDGFKLHGQVACCLHEDNTHKVYVERKK